MAYINLSKNEYEVKKQSELTVTFSTDVTLTDVKLSVNNGSTFMNCKRFTQSSATFDVSSLTNGTYTCKIKGYYSGGNNENNGNNGSGSTGVVTGSRGFNPDGSLDNSSSFTHTETYIPFSGNENATIVFGAEGWTRYIFYNSNKGVIGSSDSTSTVKSITMSQLKSLSPSAVYVRVSINQSTTITLTGGSVGAASLTEAEEVVR